jgi:hypothetical protein
VPRRRSLERAVELLVAELVRLDRALQAADLARRLVGVLGERLDLALEHLLLRSPLGLEALLDLGNSQGVVGLGGARQQVLELAVALVEELLDLGLAL